MKKIKVTLLMALTLDGKIGKDSDHFPDWTGPEDKKLFVQMTKKAGVLIMGSKTFATIGRPLPERKNIIMTRNPEKTQQKFQMSNDELRMLEFTNDTPQNILKNLASAGYEEVILAGGAEINGLFAREHLIDEVCVTICPKVFGSGISLFPADIEMDLELQTVEPISDQVVFVRYKVQK